MYYKVVVSGDEIFFENANGVEPVVGFIACRLIQAESEELAVAQVKRDILVHWNHSFNADRKLGMPRLVIEYINQIGGWFKPRIQQDFFWFTSEDHKRQQLDELTQAPRQWRFWRQT